MASFDYFPFDAGPGANLTEDRWTDLFTWMRTVGILCATAPLSTTGDLAVNPASMPVGLEIQIENGKAFIQGFYFEQTDGPEVLGITTNTSGDDRIDLVVLRLDKPNDLISYVVVEGVPDPVPVAPNPTQNSTIWDLPLAEVYVADSATEIFAMDITDERVRSMQGDGGSSAVTIDNGTGGETLVSGTSPNFSVKALDEGTGISLTSDSEAVTINTTTAIANGTADETLVAGSNPNFSVKGISAGTNISLSSDADAITITGENTPSDQPICVLRRDATFVVTNGATTTITWDTAIYDPYNMWDSGITDQEIIVPEDGWYKVILNVNWTGHNSANGSIQARADNPSETIMSSRVMMVGDEDVTNNVSCVTSLSQGDDITAKVTNNVGATISVVSLGIYAPYIAVYKIRSS